MNIDSLVRSNIKNMKAYSTARHEFSGDASIFLDANENSFGSPTSLSLNRYPDPLQVKLKDRISEIKGVPASNIFLGNGSDESIDLLFRIFCTPAVDNAIIFPPTYGMYEVCAAINDVALKKVPLTKNFQLDLPAIENAIDDHTKLIFICSPNNPSGNSMYRPDIEVLLNNFDGIIAIDEAYINYAKQRSFLSELLDYPNLVILQTFSKAWGLAAARMGMAFASEAMIGYFNKVKYPYNISLLNQEATLEALEHINIVNEWIKETVVQREWLSKELSAISFVKIVYPSDANFLLVKMEHAVNIFRELMNRSIIVRDRSQVILCDDCLRITVGTETENRQLVKILKELSK